MCGICGIIGADLSEPIALRRVSEMKRVLAHRGPDDDGFYFSSSNGGTGAAFGHRRLSIVDLNTGHQPMTNEDETLWIVYNGEIYNHQELRKDLESRGHVYKTSSDTETILHAYEEYGDDCLTKLRGMFSFALWDDRTKRLFAARDRLGIKPFYYALCNNGTLIFGSEIKSILASGLVRPTVNHHALPEFFTFGQTVNDSTLFEGVRKLMPGHWLSFDGQDLKIRRYWDWQFDESSIYKDDKFYIDRFADLIDDSVRSHLMSDVPVGLFLSGGLDSSLIAAMMARLHSDPIHTFTVGFEDRYYSEFDYARVVAAHIGSQHHERLITARQFVDAVPKLIWHEDEPLKGAPSVALYFISRLASEHVKVVLTGEGSDELFAGYNDRYWATLLNRRIAQIGGYFFPEAMRKHLVRKTLWKLPLPLSLKKKISHTILYLPSSIQGIFFDNFHSVFTREMQQELFNGRGAYGASAADPYANAIGLFKHSNAQNFLHQMLYTDVNMDLVELLMKQDQMSMAASVESRVPFLDHEVVEFAGTIPPHLKLQGRAGKLLVKKVAEKYLPHDVVHRPKMGFPVPFDRWLKDDSIGMVKEILLDQRTIDRRYFNSSYVEKLFASHRSEQRDYQNQIWMLLNFELWHRIFIDNVHRDCLPD
jgi:asparagine synthase (glutamine-hydrolysing)